MRAIAPAAAVSRARSFGGGAHGPRRAARTRILFVVAAAEGGSGSGATTPRVEAEAEAPAPLSAPLSRRRVAHVAALFAGAALAPRTGWSRAAEGAGGGRIGRVALSEAEWRAKLPADAYRVLRNAGTELPFSSPLNKEKREGTFACAGCGAPLFASAAKYDSGTGWPSFYEPIAPDAVRESRDDSIAFMPRVEVRCATCEGHLGHVFPDGPQPTGLRYCMNGCAMSFNPSS